VSCRRSIDGRPQQMRRTVGTVRGSQALACLSFCMISATSAVYTAPHSCEAELSTFTTPQGTLYTTTSDGSVNANGITGTIATSSTTTIRKYNTTEIEMALTYFMADLKAADVTAGHTQESASWYCGVTGSSSMPWSLGTLQNVVLKTIDACHYKIGVNGTHLYTVLFRIATECSQNQDDDHCLIPNGFLHAPSGPWSHTVANFSSDGPFTVTTEVTTTYTYEFTYGGSDLVRGICPAGVQAVRMFI
jgi:hypothetical protein